MSEPTETTESADNLAEAIAAVQGWPAMAKFVARCIDTVRAHEHRRGHYLKRLAEKDQELGHERRHVAALKGELARMREDMRRAGVAA